LWGVACALLVMFSRMCAERFEKERQSSVGPGSYRIPMLFDDHDKQDPGLESSGSSFLIYEDAAEKPSAKRQQTFLRVPRSRPCSATKSGQENRAPSNATIEALKRAREQLQVKDQQLEEFQRRVEELTAARSDARRHVCELCSELQERTSALEATHTYLDCLERRFASHSAATEARLQELSRSQDSLYDKVRAVETERRALAALVEESRSAQARSASQLAVRQASLAAVLELFARECCQEPQGAMTLPAREPEMGHGRVQSTKEDEVRGQFSLQVAELKGNLFVADRALALSKEQRRRLEELLATSIAGSLEVQEPQEGLQVHQTSQ